MKIKHEVTNLVNCTALNIQYLSAASGCAAKPLQLQHLNQEITLENPRHTPDMHIDVGVVVLYLNYNYHLTEVQPFQLTPTT